MCYGNPTKSLSIARERMTAEQWAKFEVDFEHFCVTSGLGVPSPLDIPGCLSFSWAKWSYLSARPRDPYPTADQRVSDAYFEKVAIASMTDEQAEMSLERWKGEAK
jgi:hypothetical protein